MAHLKWATQRMMNAAVDLHPGVFTLRVMTLPTPVLIESDGAGHQTYRCEADPMTAANRSSAVFRAVGLARYEQVPGSDPGDPLVEAAAHGPERMTVLVSHVLYSQFARLTRAYRCQLEHTERGPYFSVIGPELSRV